MNEMMKPAYLMLAAATILATAACNSEKGASSSSGAPVSNAPIKPVAAPNGGDWTKMVVRTPEGGYLMGNPNADVKLIEFGSMTCPHCADFEKQAGEKLVNDYVKTGRVSFEFRNFVRDPFDLAASLIARCGGPERFFPLTRQLFVDQANWAGKLQDIPQAQIDALQNLGPESKFLQIAKLADLQAWGAQRGVPSAASSVCLVNRKEIDQLVQMNGDATTKYPEFKGTPTFIVNDKMVDGSTWEILEPELRKALGG